MTDPFPHVATMALHPYRLPLTRPLRLSTGVLQAREGVAVQLKAPSGAEGWGDVAPLPGFSTETLETATAQLQTLTAVVEAGVSVTGLRSQLAACAPSVRFGVEGAWVALQARVQGQTVSACLGTPRATVMLNGLIVDGDVDAQAVSLQDQGYRHVKVKVGRRPVDEEAARIRRVLAATAPTLQLRLDANRAWTLAEARAMAAQIDLTRIEYIEEPLADADALPTLAADGVPVALDETVHQAPDVPLADWSYATAFVLKPTLLGLARTRQYLADAAQLGRLVTLSSSFESGLGLALLYALAASSPATQTAAGLDTYHWLAEDLLTPRPSWTGPRVPLTAWQAVSLGPLVPH
ncbi:MAG: o-succinylbenzoate synthase [Bacteroidota bacterium]